MSKIIQSGSSTRIGDHPIAFGMKRYEDFDKKPLWVFTVNKYVGGEILAKIADPSIADLVKMRRAIDEHIELLRSDGGRLEKDAAE